MPRRQTALTEDHAILAQTDHTNWGSFAQNVTSQGHMTEPFIHNQWSSLGSPSPPSTLWNAWLMGFKSWASHRGLCHSGSNMAHKMGFLGAKCDTLRTHHRAFKPQAMVIPVITHLTKYFWAFETCLSKQQLETGCLRLTGCLLLVLLWLFFCVSQNFSSPIDKSSVAIDLRQGCLGI